MKKRVLGIILGAMVTMAMSVTAFANENQSQELSVTLTAEPSYTVTIPASINMGNEGATVDVEATDIENLPEGNRVSVTIAGTDYYRNQMVLEANTTPRTSLRYQIISESGEVLETTGQANQTVGKEVVSFTEDGTKQYQIRPVISGRFEYGVAYTGSITFGIAITE